MNHPKIVLGAALLFAAIGGAQTQRPTPQTAPPGAANAWMQTPSDVSARDDLPPALRHLRDEYWDGTYGHHGVLTPRMKIVMDVDYGPGGSPVPEFYIHPKIGAALIGTLARYRSVLTASGRTIYTDLTFTVGHVFQGADGGHAVPGGEITISVLGGAVRTSGGEIISWLYAPQAYDMQPGRTYLLWDMHYHAEGDFYLYLVPEWDLSDGVAKPNFDMATAAIRGYRMTLDGLTTEEVIRLIEERLHGK